MKPEEEQYIIQRVPQCARLSPAGPAAERRCSLRWGETAERSTGLWINLGARHALPAGLARLLAADVAEG
jgi:hypothetical protein